MSEIEKMKRYIERTKMPPGKGATSTGNLLLMMEEMDQLSAILMAFNYGRAKGYRAAKAEVKA
ncbi:MAG: hypothetical protein OSJ58_09005 [Dysosmobacter sp.]|uniref:hypothetical protein n=1 Tax=uncultured Oscillibacter sp. TaxID=876091 RepID=UPI0026203F80|nr:hypothetical protein [uncultured Oscillibacter sp.]MCX4371956.1 hypothetical protein [Dysosmobacter sp.]